MESCTDATLTHRQPSNCAVDKYFDDFRSKCRQLRLPLGLISSAKNIEKQIQVLRYFVWKNAIALYGKNVEDVHNRMHPLKIPDSFKVKTIAGTQVRRGYIPHDFVNVMDLLAEDLSKFLDYWINLPKFVDERVGKAATRLHEELEVRHIQAPSSLLTTGFDHSIVSSVSAATTRVTIQTVLGYIHMIYVQSWDNKYPTFMKPSTILWRSGARHSKPVRSTDDLTYEICLPSRHSSVPWHLQWPNWPSR
jgi:hypothetical protein